MEKTVRHVIHAPEREPVHVGQRTPPLIVSRLCSLLLRQQKADITIVQLTWRATAELWAVG
jgi:hypothetical protein